MRNGSALLPKTSTTRRVKVWIRIWSLAAQSIFLTEKSLWSLGIPKMGQCVTSSNSTLPIKPWKSCHRSPKVEPLLPHTTNLKIDLSTFWAVPTRTIWWLRIVKSLMFLTTSGTKCRAWSRSAATLGRFYRLTSAICMRSRALLTSSTKPRSQCSRSRASPWTRSRGLTSGTSPRAGRP